MSEMISNVLLKISLTGTVMCGENNATRRHKFIRNVIIVSLMTKHTYRIKSAYSVNQDSAM